MKEKRNIHELIVKEEPHLHEILDPAQVSKFKELTNELRDTWTKKQMFRTKTEMEFSVLNDVDVSDKGKMVQRRNYSRSGLFGVYPINTGGYTVKIRDKDKVEQYLGYYKNKSTAAEVANKAIKRFGLNVPLNTIEE